MNSTTVNLNNISTWQSHCLGFVSREWEKKKVKLIQLRFKKLNKYSFLSNADIFSFDMVRLGRAQWKTFLKRYLLFKDILSPESTFTGRKKSVHAYVPAEDDNSNIFGAFSREEKD